jgi:hypothetical protein
VSIHGSAVLSSVGIPNIFEYKKMHKTKASLLQVGVLQVAIDKILIDYGKMLKGKISKESASTSIGFQIDNLKHYEIENGLYPSRSIVVLPKSSPMIDLLLVYHTVHGTVKYELNVKHEGKSQYRIYKNSLTKYIDEKSEASTSSEIIIDATIDKFVDLSEMSTRSTRLKKSPPERLPKQICFLCPTKNRECCFLQDQHSSACSNCCLSKEHCHL